MTHNLSTKYRAIVHYSHFCRSLRKVSKIYGISKSSLQRWVRQSNHPSTVRKTRTKKQTRRDVLNCIHTSLKTNPFLTMQQLAGIVSSQCGVLRSRRTVHRYVLQNGWSRKKAFRTVRPKERDLSLVSGFCSQYLRCEDSLICIDEAAFFLGDHPTHGWSRRGERIRTTSGTSLRRNKLTVIMAVTSSGILHYEVLDHNCRKEDFMGFIQRLPVPPGSALLLDNIRFHHSQDVRSVADRRGFEMLFIPPYSPRFNAIENVFGILKPLYRRRCPPNFSSCTDYRQLFEDSINSLSCNFMGLFSKVSRSVRAVMEQLPCIMRIRSHDGYTVLSSSRL